MISPSSLSRVLSRSLRPAAPLCLRVGSSTPGTFLQNVRHIGRLRPPNHPIDRLDWTGAERGALERILDEEAGWRLKDSPVRTIPPPDGAVVVRSHNRPTPSAGSNLPVQTYPGHPHN